MNNIEKARYFRQFIEKMASEVNDETALEHPEAFPKWEVGITFTEDDENKTRVRYNDILYKVVSAHTTQADWTPDVAVSLFVRVDDPAIEWPEWVQPVGALDAYALGAKVSHNDKYWVSNTANNVWEPGVYGWDEV